ncbi:MAG: response regulator [Paracoccaceae bacterium]
MTDRGIQVVEDDEAVGASLVALLESYGRRVTLHHSGEAFLGAASTPASCVILDMRLPGMDGFAVLSALRARGDATPVIVVTGHGDVAMAVKALRGGAQDFIEKPYDDADLLRRIETVEVERAPQDESARHLERFNRLTPRETDVMHEIVAGYSNKIAAHRLGLSPKTVEIHRARVMEKTGAQNLSQLVRMALKAGLDPGDGDS